MTGFYLFVIVTMALSCAAAVRADDSPGPQSASAPQWVYIGTYTAKPAKPDGKPSSQGIYLCKLDPATGVLGQPELAAKMSNPSFFAISPDRKFLYAIGEFSDTVAAYAIEQGGKLSLLNEQPAGGKGPAHVALDATGRTAIVANYGSGSVASYAVGEDGKLSEPVTIDQHPGPKPHAHYAQVDPSNRFVLVCELGLDKVYVYRLDPAKSALSANDPPSVSLAAGSGPRHLTFSANGKFVYTINELASTITAFTWDGEHGVLQEIQTLSTLPDDFKGHNSTAEIVVHPSGKFLYGSNRGHNSIAEFSVDESTGRLTLIGHTPSGGKTPRGFGVDPTGRWLIVGNQDSYNLVEFGIDAATGKLKPTGTMYDLGAPVCVKFMEAKR